MSYRVFEKIHVSHKVMKLRDSFSGLFREMGICGVDGAAEVGRTLAGNAGYCFENAGMNGAFDRGSFGTLMDRLLGLNGRNRLSC
jgi:hypothetical protein